MGLRRSNQCIKEWRGLYFRRPERRHRRPDYAAATARPHRSIILDGYLNVLAAAGNRVARPRFAIQAERERHHNAPCSRRSVVA